MKLDGGAAANAPLIRALVSALIERVEARSTITLMSEGLAQLRGRVAAGPAEATARGGRGADVWRAAVTAERPPDFAAQPAPGSPVRARAGVEADRHHGQQALLRSQQRP